MVLGGEGVSAGRGGDVPSGLLTQRLGLGSPPPGFLWTQARILCNGPFARDPKTAATEGEGGRVRGTFRGRL